MTRRAIEAAEPEPESRRRVIHRRPDVEFETVWSGAMEREGTARVVIGGAFERREPLIPMVR
jgi:hypothetical protein